MKQDLTYAFRLADKLGLSEGINNHFSFLHPTHKDRFIINPLGYHWSELKPEDLVTVSIRGELLEGNNFPEDTAFYIHSTIHELNPHAQVIMHTHMPYATSLTLLENCQLEPISQTAMQFWGRTIFINTFTGIIDNRERGLQLARDIQNHEIIFLANHGVIVIAKTIAKAFDDLYFLERAAQLQVLAYSTGKELKLISDSLRKETADKFSTTADLSDLFFTAMKRSVFKNQFLEEIV